MMRFLFLAFAVVAAGSALANIPDLNLCVLENAAGSDGAVLYVLPSGAGNDFTNARLAGGVVVDATLTLTVVNSLGDPIANYPAEDMWLGSSGGGFVACDNANPDSPTNATGQTQWIASPAAGGNSLGEGAQAFIAGEPALIAAEVQFVSADINGDLQVNLSDISVFTQALNAYNADADFNHDQQVNLSDIGVMTQAIGTVCR